jgi:hypothetical protein
MHFLVRHHGGILDAKRRHHVGVRTRSQHKRST